MIQNGNKCRNPAYWLMSPCSVFPVRLRVSQFAPLQFILLSLQRPRRAIAPFQGYPQSRPPQTLGTRTNFLPQISVPRVYLATLFPRVYLATRPFSFKFKRVLSLALLSSAPSVSNLPSHWSPITSPLYVNHYPRKFPDSTNSPITQSCCHWAQLTNSSSRVTQY